MRPIIDVHTHAFNHRHLPVEGLTRATLVSAGVNRGLARRAARLFRKLVTMLAKDEDRALEVGREVVRARTVDELARPITRVALTCQRERLEGLGFESFPHRGSLPEERAAFAEAMRADDWQQLVDELDDFLRQEGAPRRRAEPERVTDDLEGHFRRSIRWTVKTFLEWLASHVEAQFGYVHFVISLLGPVEDIWERLQNTYDPGQVDLFVHLMMDMRDAYRVDASGNTLPDKDKPKSPALRYKRQIKEMIDLTWASRGRLVGFVAFEPRRRRAMEHVKRALDGGMVGVKLYPPMGYWALDPRWKAKLDEVYAYCVSLDVPVMTHCSPTGFEAYPGHGVYSAPTDPHSWAAVLERHPTLRLCLGHAGGGTDENYPTPDPAEDEEKVPFPGWYDAEADWDDPRCLTRQVLELCSDARYEHVYTDLSYFIDMIDHPVRMDRVGTHLVRLLRAGTPESARLAGRLMFGSDWHMPNAITMADDSLQCFREIFEDHGLQAEAPGFFGKNAVDYLNLRATAQRLRGTLGTLTPNQRAALDFWESLG